MIVFAVLSVIAGLPRTDQASALSYMQAWQMCCPASFHQLQNARAFIRNWRQHSACIAEHGLAADSLCRCRFCDLWRDTR